MSSSSFPGSFDTEAFSFMSDVAALEEFQKVVQEIDNPQLQQKVQQAMNKVITPWTQRQDDLISTLNQVEKSYAALQQENHAKSALYHKSVRDLQIYKAKYHSIHYNHSSVANHSVNKVNNTTCPSTLPGDPPTDHRSLSTIDTFSSNISITSSSDYSHATKSSTHIDDKHSSLSFSNSFLTTNDNSMNDQFDLLSIIDQNYPIYIPPQKPPPSNDLPLPPLPISSSSPHPPTTKNTICQKYQCKSPTPPPPPSTEELKFACGDGFWNTIAKGKSNKNEVDLLIKNYLKRGGQANVANNSGTIQSIKEGYGLIHALIVIKNTSALQRVIEAGANPHALPLQGTSDNHRNKENNNIAPLVLAAQLGYLNGVRLLVERAHVNVLASKGPRQENALLAAIQANAFDVVTYLLKVSNQLLDQADIFGATPLHYACMTGKTKMISFLVRECGQLPEATDYKGETPLHYAIRHRQAKAVAYLVGELDAYPNTYVIKKVPTPLDLAKAKGLRNVAEFLKKMGAKSTKEMEKKPSSVFAIPVSRMESPGSTATAASESSNFSLVKSNYSLHSIHSGRTSTSNESIII